MMMMMMTMMMVMMMMMMIIIIIKAKAFLIFLGDHPENSWHEISSYSIRIELFYLYHCSLIVCYEYSH